MAMCDMCTNFTRHLFAYTNNGPKKECTLSKMGKNQLR